MQHHPIGTEIYYAGGIANTPGLGKIVRLDQSPWFGATYDIEIEDGRPLPGYPGHVGQRHVRRPSQPAHCHQSGV
jgi:hypothetical protein